jgi:hypothetical protein
MTQLEQGFATGGMGINSYCAKRKILGPNVCTGSFAAAVSERQVRLCPLCPNSDEFRILLKCRDVP